MKKIFYFIASAIVALGAVACQNDINEGVTPEQEGFSINVTIADQTRVALGDLNEETKQRKLTFTEGDVLVVREEFQVGTNYFFTYTKGEGDVYTFTCEQEGVNSLVGKTPYVFYLGGLHEQADDLKPYGAFCNTAAENISGIGMSANPTCYSGKFGDKDCTISLQTLPVLKFTAQEAVTISSEDNASLFFVNDSWANTYTTTTIGEIYLPVMSSSGNCTVTVTTESGFNKSFTKTLDWGKIYNLGTIEAAAPAPVEVTATITFDDKAKRYSFSNSQQAWYENGITVTNDKGSSTSNVGDYAKPARFYKSSELTIEARGGNITKIVFDCNNSTYANALKNSIGDAATVSSDKVTVTLDGTSKTYTIESLSGGQVQMDALTVTYVESGDAPAQKGRNLTFSADTATATIGATDNEYPSLSGDTAYVTYSSSNTDVATINASGVVTLVGAGSTTITATAPETAEYEAGVASYTLTVLAAQGGDEGDDDEVNEVIDVLNRALTGATGTTYSTWSGKTSVSDAVYAGNSAGDKESIQLRSNNSNSGIVTTTSGGYAKKVVVTWNSGTSDGRTLDIYGKNSAYTAATDLYNNSNKGTKLGSIVKGTSTELVIDGDYEYIGLRSNSGAMYLTEIKITWSSEASGETPEPEEPETPVEPEEPTGPVVVTVAEFLAAAQDDTIYQLTGTITGTYNTDYGNFYLEDTTGKVLIYGIYQNGNKCYTALDLADGDIVTVQGKTNIYNSAVQMKNAEYISHIVTPSVKLDSEALVFSSEAGSKNIVATTHGEGTLTVTETADWITCTLSGKTLTVSVTANSGEERTADITVEFAGNTKTISVTQEKKSATGGGSVTQKITFSNSYSTDTDVNGKNIAIDSNVNVKFAKASGSTNPRYYKNGTSVRTYAKNTITVSSTSKKITKITFTYGSSDGSNAITANTGSFTSPNWTGSANSVVFTIGGTSGNRRISAIEVTYE